MLTTSVIKNSAGAAQYYSKEDNYYLSEVDAKEASMWIGEGAARLGLSGKVAEKELHTLLSGKLPNGSVIGLQRDGTINHRPGYDLCFQAPKSISILALDGGDKRLYDAHLEAVKETLKVIERDCAQVKVYKNKQISFENTNNLAVALIAHTTSRKLDLHLHHHALVMNCTQKEDGSWRALASNKVNSEQIQGFSERIYKHRIYYGLIYQAALANRVINLGYAIETVGPHGMWEIKGVPKEAREVMSKRRKEIEKKLKDLNYRSLKAADIATLDTREKKQTNISIEELKQSWKNELAAVGFASKEFIAAVMSKKMDLGADSIAKESKSNSEISIRSKEAVYAAIEHLSQFSLKLDYTKIAACALEFSIGNTSHWDIIHALDKIIQKREIIPLDKLESLFATKTLIETEKTIMDLVAASKESVSSIALKSKEIAKIENQEVKESCLKILQAKDRLYLIEHIGADNQELISAVLALAESSGKTVRVLSPNRMMTYDINENIKRKPNGLWQWLVSLGKPEIGECVAGFLYKYQAEMEHGLFSRQDKDLFIVNNAETLGGSNLKSLLELTAKTKARVIFLRDISVRQGFGAGNPMGTLKQAGIASGRLISNSAKTTRIGRVPEVRAIQDDTDRAKALAKAFAKKGDKERENTLILVSAKSQIKKTNAAIRDELKSLGKLAAEEYRFSVLNTAGLSKVESSLAHKYQNNMVIRFYAKGKPPADWSVNSSNRDNNTIRLKLENKSTNSERNIEQISWDPKQHQASSYSIFKREVLGIAQGDQLVATAKMHRFGINQAEKFTVVALGENHIELLSNKNKVYRISKTDLKDSHFDYAYATTLGRSSPKQVAHIIADFKAYALDKMILNALNLRAKEAVIIFTNDAKTLQKRFGIVPTKLTGAETVLKAATPERLISDKTISEIKSDIDAAITGLSVSQDASAAQKAVDYALAKITSRQAGFTHKELVIEALAYALTDQIAVSSKEITHEDIMNIIVEKHQAGELVMGKYFADGTRWTTKEILATERSIIERLKAGINKLEPLLDKEQAAKIVADSNLTQDQKNGCNLIVTTKDQFVIIQGYAGTGKTAMFGQVQEMLKSVNIANSAKNTVETNEIKEKSLTANNHLIQMLALAPTHKTVKELKKVGIEAQTLKSFLLEQQKNQANLDNMLMVLDEDSMVSNQDFDKFLDLVKDTKAHVLLGGDTDQHLAIEAGKPLEIALKAEILKVVYLREIVRQKNPVLKAAVENIINKDYKVAFEKIAAENPKDYILRNSNQKSEFADINSDPEKLRGNSFFNRLQHSIVEVDNNAIKPGKATLEQRTAEDYLSRTLETREKTVVIVHSNHDRRIITELIRSGLKEQGEIANSGGIITNCLITKGLIAVEYQSASSYSNGDIVKIGREYYKVDENDPTLKSILLKDESDKTRYFYPEKEATKYNVELYECIQSELAVGDTIRLTKTDKERERYANFEYRVAAIANNAITLKSKDPENEQLILRPESFKDAHWDYAQTVTGYGIQGGSKTYVIDFEVSYRKNLANQRSFYVAASRAIQHLIIYTDNKDKLLDRIVKNKGDKYSALDIVDEFGNRERSSKEAKLEKNNPASLSESLQLKPGLSKDFSASDYNRIKELINSTAELFIERILGKPNPKLSTPTEWRYGRKGSLAINMNSEKKGLWHNFETGESGNLVALIKKETGLSFKETLKYVAGISEAKPITSEKVKLNLTKTHKKANTKTNNYAMTLVKESIPIRETIAEKYLRYTRGIKNLELKDVRYHPNVYVGKGEAQKYYPAIIAISRDKDNIVKCVQATYLDPKTSDKAKLEVKKRTYSSPAEAAVLLNKSSAKDRISYITEGIETGLSIKDAIVQGEVLVTLGKSNFIGLPLEKLGQKIVFCLDNDGKNIYQDQVIFKAAERLIRAGKEVYFTMPEQINKQKTDFNDVIKTQGISAVRNYLAKIKSYDKADKKIELSRDPSYNNNDKTIEPNKNKSDDLNKVNISSPNLLEKQQELNNHLQKDFKQRGFAREL